MPSCLPAAGEELRAAQAKPGRRVPASGNFPDAGSSVAIWNFVGMWTVSGWGYGM
jgi:hypothetical protein